MGLTISIGGGLGFEEIPITGRIHKGKSYIDFPSEYCVVDIETTGLSPQYDEIIEIGAIKYSNGKEVGRFESLIQPPKSGGKFVPYFITELTGITNEMLEDAPKTQEVINEFERFLGDSVIVGYNISFDVNFLYDNFEKYAPRPLSNNYIDVMRMARKLYPDMEHHRLFDMVDRFDLTNDDEHRAFSDCVATAKCYKRIYDEVKSKFENIEAFIDLFAPKYLKLKASDIVGDESKIDKDSPLYAKRCVFTGKLEKFTRREAMQIVADLGGINENGVTKNTNFLILGNNDYCTSIKEGKSSKQKKAEQYKLNGQDIEIIPETVFYDMLGEEF